MAKYLNLCAEMNNVRSLLSSLASLISTKLQPLDDSITNFRINGGTCFVIALQ
jgi:hypothetical protein